MSGKAAIIAVVATAGIRQSLQALEIPTGLFNHNLHGESAMRRTSSIHGIVKRCIWVRLQVNVLWAASKIVLVLAGSLNQRSWSKKVDISGAGACEKQQHVGQVARRIVIWCYQP